MKALFEYFDYQEYLCDFYQEKKRENNYISFRYLGSRLGLDPGFLLKVMQGKLHLADKSLGRLCEFFKFSASQAEYFKMLIHYNKAKTNSDIKLYFEKLLSLRDSKARPLQESQYAFYQKWYHSAIHALLSIYEFKGAFKELASRLRPAISVAQAKESIHLLQKLKMVYCNQDGIYKPTDAFVTSGEKWHSTALHEFQKETIRLSEQSLDRVAKELRDISTVTVALSSKDLPEIRERIRQLRQSILSLENENKPDAVFQINIQVFPVTNATGGDQ
jgi:uncharacterized protein (TIGR02147 family)